MRMHCMHVSILLVRTIPTTFTVQYFTSPVHALLLYFASHGQTGSLKVFAVHRNVMWSFFVASYSHGYFFKWRLGPSVGWRASATTTISFTPFWHTNGWSRGWGNQFFKFRWLARHIQWLSRWRVHFFSSTTCSASSEHSFGKRRPKARQRSSQGHVWIQKPQVRLKPRCSRSITPFWTSTQFHWICTAGSCSKNRGKKNLGFWIYNMQDLQHVFCSKLWSFCSVYFLLLILDDFIWTIDFFLVWYDTIFKFWLTLPSKIPNSGRRWLQSHKWMQFVQKHWPMQMCSKFRNSVTYSRPTNPHQICSGNWFNPCWEPGKTMFRQMTI